MVTLNTNIALAPGTYVVQSEAGFLPVELASFNRTYMLGTGSTGPLNKPTQIISTEDFTNQFGSSSSLESVALYFANNPNGVLFFVNCDHPQMIELTVGTPAAGAYSITIDGTTVTYTADATPTAAEITAGLVAAINANTTVNVLVLATDGTVGDTKLRIRVLTADQAAVVFSAPTAPGGSTLTASTDLTASTSFLDAVWACENAFDSELAQGFLIAPEFFSSVTGQSDRTSIATAMENLAAREGFDWMALVDSGPSTGTGAIDTAAKANVEAQLYTTTRGHLAYFFPYVVDLTDNVIPSSAAIAGLAIRRYRDQGFQQPPAGVTYAIRGVKDVAVKLTKAQQEVANPLGVNYIRNLPNKGVVCWGSRTRSTNPYYRFVNVRIIINVLAGTLKTAFDSLIFTAVDGQGVLFTRIRATIEQICYRLWTGGALFGQSPREAFAVKCDLTNNPAIDLEAGVVRADCWIVPSPTMERLFINVVRVPIGQIQTVVGDSVGG